MDDNIGKNCKSDTRDVRPENLTPRCHARLPPVESISSIDLCNPHFS